MRQSTARKAAGPGYASGFLGRRLVAPSTQVLGVVLSAQVLSAISTVGSRRSSRFGSSAPESNLTPRAACWSAPRRGWRSGTARHAGPH